MIGSNICVCMINGRVTMRMYEMPSRIFGAWLHF